MNMLVSLGNFGGGYIIYRFDQLITNDPNHPYGVDFVVRGNNYGTNHFGFYEPANVLVSQDGKTWYTLAGSDHYSNHAYWDYTITTPSPPAPPPSMAALPVRRQTGQTAWAIPAPAISIPTKPSIPVPWTAE